jgi:uncharacterized protein (DUF2236 family)
MSAPLPAAPSAPGQPLWQIHRERVLLAGAGRAILLQLAHPLVAAGVAAHSGFARDPMTRLRRTLDITYALVFGDDGQAGQAAGALAAAHRPVRGVLDRAVGRYPAGTPYDAGDPALALWVHATLIDTALVVHRRFIGPLPAPVLERYHLEAAVLARRLGVRGEAVLARRGDFEAYVSAMVAGDGLAVDAPTRRVLRPRAPWSLRAAGPVVAFLTAGLLPPPLREAFGLRWSAGRERLLAALAAASRALVPWLPDPLRAVAPARRAERRLRGAAPIAAPSPHRRASGRAEPIDAAGPGA